MTLYRIFMVVMERKRGGKIVDVARKEKFVVDNLDRAREVCADILNEFKCWVMYSKYFGHVSLIIPTIHTNGDVGYWGEEIEIYKKEQ